MNDRELELIRKFMLEFKTIDEFNKYYIDVYNPNNRSELLKTFEIVNSNQEVWEMYKYFSSSESLKIYESKDTNEIINYLDNLDLSSYKRIIVKLDNRTYKDIDKLKIYNKDIYILINGDKGLCSIDDFKRMREYFDYFKNEYSSYNLSQLELITLAYDYVKFFKYNIEDNGCKTESRSIAKSLSSGHIVCEGYAKIFSELLHEFNIDSYLIYLYQNNDKTLGHVRNIIYINDDKYNINGYYAFDSTWDSYKEDYDYSTISYLYYMIPLCNYFDVFKNEEINRFVDYNSNSVINFDFNSENKSNYSIDILKSILRKIKIIEGYSNIQIEDYINSSINLIYNNSIILRKRLN